MLTSNLPSSAWVSIFKNPMATAAGIDRLVHHGGVLRRNVSSRDGFRDARPPGT
jgi:DNA replication protein DnaC